MSTYRALESWLQNPDMFALSTEFNTTEDGWLIYNDSHYYINNDNLAMEVARAYCKKNFGELVVITGESERKFLWKQVRNLFSKQIWELKMTTMLHPL